MSSPAFGSLPIRTANPGDVVVYLASPSGSAFGTEANPLVVQNSSAGASEVQVTNTTSVSGTVSVSGLTFDSSGNLNVNLETSLPAGNNLVGTFGIDQTDPGISNVVHIGGLASVQIYDASGNPFGVNGNPVITGLVDASHNPFGTSINPIYVSSTAASGIQNVEVLNTVAVSGAISIGTALPSGANLIGSIDVANTVAVSGSVNIGGAGLGSSSANPLYVSTGAGTSGALFNSGQLSTSVAGGSNATLATAPFSAGVAASLVNLVVAGSAAARYDFQVVNNSGTATTIFSMFTTASQPNAIFKPYVDGEIISAAADGTNAKYQVVVNNIDVVTTNFYAYMAWSQP
jgi:hypothetical protein